MVVASLRAKFPALWEALGSPEHWLYMKTTTKTRHFFTFLDTKKFLETNDQNFIRQCRALRIGWYAFFFLFLATLLFALGNIVLIAMTT